MDITRRSFVAGVRLAGLAVTGLGALAYRAISSDRRPNIVLFIADDLRYDAVGFAGNTIIHTPHLNQLAESSVVFDNNFVTTSVCPVSRASILTGQYALRHGVIDFRTSLRQRSFQRTFPKLLRDTGYYTGFIGKWGLGGRIPRRAFDQWYGFEGQGNYHNGSGRHLTDRQTAQALRFINSCPKDKPFMLVVAYKAPHIPLKPQDKFADLYVNDTIPRLPADKPHAARYSGLLKNSLDRDEYLRQRYFDDEFFQDSMRKYYRLISGVDESVGMVLGKLKESGRLDNTSVMFTSDNGMLLGEHGLDGKWCMYEGSIRTPMLVRPSPAHYPDIKPSRQNAMTLNIDICPTLLAMAELGAPSSVQGKNLLPLMQGKQNEPLRDGFYYEHPGWGHMRVVSCRGYRGTNWKYTRYGEGKGAQEMLFNLKEDPHEGINLAGDPAHAQTLAGMRKKMRASRRKLQSA